MLKILGTGGVRAGKGINSVFSNKDMDDIIIIQSLENLGVIIELVKLKHEIKWQEGGFLGMLFRTLGVSLLENIN